MGLFDSLFAPENAAQLALASGLLSGKGSFGGILGQSLMQANQAQQQANAIKRQAELDALQKQRFQLQLNEEQRKQKQFDRSESFREGIPAPDFGPPTIANANDPVKQTQRLMYGALKSGDLSPLDYIKTLQKDETPLSVAEGTSLLDRKTLRPLYTGQAKQPDIVKEFQYAQNNPAFTPWAQGMKKAGASNVDVKIQNALGGGLAKGVTERAQAGQDQALGAIQSIQNADSIIRAIDSNKVLAGPGSSFKLKGLQIGQVLGVGGKDSAETVMNTRATIQGLAQATVAARAALKGQGQVSDFEGKLLAQAASGNIDEMTGPEIRQIAVLNKKLGQQLINQHNEYITRVKKNRDPEISGLADLYSIEQPKSGVVDWGDLGRTPTGR